MVISIASKDTFVSAEKLEQQKTHAYSVRSAAIAAIKESLQLSREFNWESIEKYPDLNEMYNELFAVMSKYKA